MPALVDWASRGHHLRGWGGTGEERQGGRGTRLVFLVGAGLVAVGKGGKDGGGSYGGGGGEVGI